MQHHTLVTPTRILFSDVELAAYLGIRLSTLRKWRVLGVGVPWIKVGSLVRYRLSDVEEYLNACPKGGRPAA